MNWADIAILVIVGASAIISLFRGFVREVLSLVAWIVAFFVAFTFTPRASELLAGFVTIPTARYVMAFVGLLVASLIFLGIVTYLVGKLVDKTGLSTTDRMLGAVFGMVRGGAVVLALVFVAGLTPVPQDPWWKESALLGRFEQLSWWIISYLPQDAAENFDY